MKLKLNAIFWVTILLLHSCESKKSVFIDFEKTIPQVEFAVEDMEKTLLEKDYELKENASFRILIAIDTAFNQPEGFRITKPNNKTLQLLSGDANGLMYACFELNELIRTGEILENINHIEEKPYIPKRGIKFNIPLDIRTSAFDDSGDAAQNNIAEMWNYDFWVAFFDNMARYRYNAISFWNAHPFSSMVKLDDYPDVALQDVCGTTIKPQDEPWAWNVPEMASAKPVANLKVLKKMSIDEKIEFWQKVMRHAKNRGIDVYFITWNICLNGAAVPGPNAEVGDKKGKYGISNDYQNQTSIDYLRKSVKQFILNYPDLTGLGVTAGENMRKPMTDEDKEKWLWDTYGMGILDAKVVQPEREIKFIHRFWWTDMEKIMKYWGDYPDQFDMSFKYAKARLYSHENPPFADPLLDWMAPQNLKSWWNLRNDDIFIHRWGDPAYVSGFIKNMPYKATAGYHMGSDGYVWGREFISKNPESPRMLEINKHWFRFLLWGRLGYNPDIPLERFEKILAARFPETDAKLLLKTWQHSSKIIPQINRFHWRDWDYMWQPEACMSGGKDLVTVDDFRTNPTMQGSGILNPFDFVKASLAKSEIKKITPLDVAAKLEQSAATALKGANELLNSETTKELEQTLLDIQAMAHLGRYYSNKIKGAIELEFFKQSGNEEHKQKAVEYLKQATNWWQEYRDVNIDRYEKQNFARLRTFDFDKNLELTRNDIELAVKALSYASEK
ncbi:hypothetical protein [uncultured Draconibacterium sp.]|uniref:hypothetical protein n=1 Tax=uncultured Draconibacterium sp. TaxID=1573823 RepID=UPI0032617419